MRGIFALLPCILLAFPALAQPVVGISAINGDGDSVRAMITQVAASGATPLLLSNFPARDPEADIAKIDALVLMGNPLDIDPARYGAARHPETKSEADSEAGRARAAYEYAILEKALAQKMPVLGICGGHQRLNVLLGGTMHQHVPDLVGHEHHAQHRAGIPPFVPVVPIAIERGTRLAEIADGVEALYAPAHAADQTLMENSMHHQAVDQLGEGLRAAAFADAFEQEGQKKRLIEAIEADPSGPLAGQFVLGVQWHPEFSASPLGPAITKTLVQEAEAYAAAGNRKHPAGEALAETRASAPPAAEASTPAPQ